MTSSLADSVVTNMKTGVGFGCSSERAGLLDLLGEREQRIVTRHIWFPI